MVAMSVQRLCEEMEYSELLDRLPAVADPHERMVHEFSIFHICKYLKGIKCMRCRLQTLVP